MIENADEGGPVIHAWRDVFNTNWRVHSFMGWRPNIPGGIDGVFLGYFMLAAVFVTAMDFTPGVGYLFGVIPWLPRHVVIPAYIAWTATMATPDDRSAVRYLLSRARLQLENLELPKPHPSPERIPVRHDETGSGGARPGRVVGPAYVEFNQPVRIRAHSKGYTVTSDAEGVTGPIVLNPNTSLTVR